MTDDLMGHVWFTQVFGLEGVTTLPASSVVAFFDLHPVWLVVFAVLTSASDVTVPDVGWDQVWVLWSTTTFGDGVFQVKDIDTLSLTQDFESF